MRALGHILFASIFKCVNNFRKGPRANPIACGLLSALGAATLGVGILAVVEEANASQATAASILSKIFGPLAIIGKPLLFSGEVGLLVLGALDIVGDFGVGIVQVSTAGSG